ncbi:hypothetical protein TKK_0012899 [Trichogramma kaykai]|uniref:Odorant receptor n=1 Tax=Trichogramma kaykai TaxID=54128 RepID=A0ABD2WMB0_9HYME
MELFETKFIAETKEQFFETFNWSQCSPFDCKVEHFRRLINYLNSVVFFEFSLLKNKSISLLQIIVSFVVLTKFVNIFTHSYASYVTVSFLEFDTYSLEALISLYYYYCVAKCVSLVYIWKRKSIKMFQVIQLHLLVMHNYPNEDLSLRMRVPMSWGYTFTKFCNSLLFVFGIISSLWIFQSKPLVSEIDEYNWLKKYLPHVSDRYNLMLFQSIILFNASLILLSFFWTNYNAYSSFLIGLFNTITQRLNRVKERYYYGTDDAGQSFTEELMSIKEHHQKIMSTLKELRNFFNQSYNLLSMFIVKTLASILMFCCLYPDNRYEVFDCATIISQLGACLAYLLVVHLMSRRLMRSSYRIAHTGSSLYDERELTKEMIELLEPIAQLATENIDSKAEVWIMSVYSFFFKVLSFLCPSLKNTRFYEEFTRKYS